MSYFCSNQSRDVGHVCHKIRSYLVCNLPHSGIVQQSGVGTNTSYHQPGPKCTSKLIHLVIVNVASVRLWEGLE